MSDALIDAKIAASEARTDAKFTRLEGKLDLLAADITGLRTDVRGTRSAVWQGVAVVVGVLIAVLALMSQVFQSSFEAGLGMREIARQEMAARPTPAAPPANTADKTAGPAK